MSFSTATAVVIMATLGFILAQDQVGTPTERPGLLARLWTAVRGPTPPPKIINHDVFHGAWPQALTGQHGQMNGLNGLNGLSGFYPDPYSQQALVAQASFENYLRYPVFIPIDRERNRQSNENNNNNQNDRWRHTNN